MTSTPPPDPSAVVIDTNVLVGAGFRPDSGAGQVVRAVREGRVRMVWNEATRREIHAVFVRIPPLRWEEIAGLFREEDRGMDDLDESGLDWVADPEDRKFAALACATGATLISNDDHLLARREEATVTVLRSGEYAEKLRRSRAP